MAGTTSRMVSVKRERCHKTTATDLVFNYLPCLASVFLKFRQKFSVK
jgi:hypothetical protein